MNKLIPFGEWNEEYQSAQWKIEIQGYSLFAF